MTYVRRFTHTEEVLGLAPLTFYAVGMILGAGIYSVIGKAAAQAGHALWLSYAAAGAALFTGLSYAELATTYPRAGAEGGVRARGVRRPPLPGPARSRSASRRGPSARPGLARASSRRVSRGGQP